MYELGLSGRADSKQARARLIKHLNLPENLSANALLDAINALGNDETVKRCIERLSSEEEKSV